MGTELSFEPRRVAPERQHASVRVLIVDDHGLFRTGLASVLGAEPGIRVIGEASGGQSAVCLAEELGPDVVLMDLQLPDLDGVSAARMILERDPDISVIALTVLAEDDDVRAALSSGISGYLAKDAPVDDIVSAVRAAATGVAWLSPRAAQVVLGRHQWADPAFDEVPDLSPREFDVLRLLTHGMENGEIAEALDLSPRAAKNHVSSILAKLGLSSRIEAAIYAVRGGLD